MDDALTAGSTPLSIGDAAGSAPSALEIAAGQFLGMSREQVMRAADETLEGHQRAILGSMTVEEVFQDREKFADEVLQTAAVDIGCMGCVPACPKEPRSLLGWVTYDCCHHFNLA